MRVLVATVVHHPEDARILHRQARALVDAGHRVTYLAPFTARGVTPRSWVEAVDVPRATRRHRWTAVRAARVEIARRVDDVDVVLLHDPELLATVVGRTHRLPPAVWDVHEDTAAALELKAWLPPWARPVVRAAVAGAERWAEGHVNLILAEGGYADRFRGAHPVVPNDTTVPAQVLPPGSDRVVYLGTLSAARGAGELVEAARLLRGHGIRTDVIGPADAQARSLLADAVASGLITWHGFVPNDAAMRLIEGALAGISPLRDHANYRHSMPTKVVEYMSRGVPVITTPLPRAADLVRRFACGDVVPFRDPAAIADAVLALRADPVRRIEAARRGHAGAMREHHWPNAATAFVAFLEQVAGSARGVAVRSR